jgi:hypothetical protein
LRQKLFTDGVGVRNQLGVYIVMCQCGSQSYKSFEDLRLFDQEKFIEVRDKGEGQQGVQVAGCCFTYPASLKEFSAAIAAFLPRTSALKLRWQSEWPLFLHFDKVVSVRRSPESPFKYLSETVVSITQRCEGEISLTNDCSDMHFTSSISCIGFF